MRLDPSRVQGVPFGPPLLPEPPRANFVSRARDAVHVGKSRSLSLASTCYPFQGGEREKLLDLAINRVRQFRSAYKS